MRNIRVIRLRSRVAGLAMACVLALTATPLQATPDARADADIHHLLAFVAASNCTFIRNGDAHDAKSASEHLAMKYGKAKSRLATPEQFIEHVASKSFFTGKPYRVQCPAQAERNTSDWLRAELGSWRTISAPTAASASAPATTAMAQRSNRATPTR